MPTNKEQVGAILVEPDAPEGIAPIPSNNTLMILQLTENEPLVPRLADNLRTMDDVFRHFDPAVAVDMVDSEGRVTPEQLRFSNVGDFRPERIIGQSAFLNQLQNRQRDYAAIIRQLRSNKGLQRAMADPALKASFLDTLRLLAGELEQAIAQSDISISH